MFEAFKKKADPQAGVVKEFYSDREGDGVLREKIRLIPKGEYNAFATERFKTDIGTTALKAVYDRDSTDWHLSRIIEIDQDGSINESPYGKAHCVFDALHACCAYGQNRIPAASEEEGWGKMTHWRKAAADAKQLIDINGAVWPVANRRLLVNHVVSYSKDQERLLEVEDRREKSPAASVPQQRPSPSRSGGEGSYSNKDEGWPTWAKWLAGSMMVLPYLFTVPKFLLLHEWETQKDDFRVAFASAQKAVTSNSPQGIAELKSALPRISQLSEAVKANEYARAHYLSENADCWVEHPTFRKCFVGELFAEAIDSGNGEAMAYLYAADPEGIANRREMGSKYSQHRIDQAFSVLMTWTGSSPAKWELGSFLLERGADPELAGTDRDMINHIRNQGPPSDFMKQVEAAGDNILDVSKEGFISPRDQRYIESKLGITDFKLSNKKCDIPYYTDLVSWQFTGRKGNETGIGCVVSPTRGGEGLWFETPSQAKSALKGDMEKGESGTYIFTSKGEGLTHIEFLGKAPTKTADERCTSGNYSFAFNFEATTKKKGHPVTGTACREYGPHAGWTDIIFNGPR